MPVFIVTRRLLFILALFITLPVVGLSQGSPPLTVQEADGSPRKNGITKIVVTNGSLTISGNTATITTGGGSGLTVGTTTIASGTSTRVLYNNAGVLGEYVITGTGNVAMSASPTFTGTVAAAAATFSGTIVQTSASATAFESGPNGGTNPVFRLVNSTASAATGLSVTGNAAGSGVTLTALSSGSNESITLTPKGTGAVVAPAGGSASALGLILGSASQGGFWGGGGFFQAVVNGTLSTQWTASYFLVATGDLRWGSSGDTYLRRNAAAHLTLGTADAASPVAQTLSVQNVVGGTSNIAGATTTLRGSLGTSQGAPGRIHLTGGALIAASGTTQQTAVDRAIFGASKVLVDNTTTTVTNVTVAGDTVASGIVEYVVEVFDGTDLQLESGSFIYQVTNKGGTIANNTITRPGASGVGVTTFYPVNTATSGTLAVTWTITAANPALLQINANSSLTPSTGYPRVTYTLRNLTQQAIAVQ